MRRFTLKRILLGITSLLVFTSVTAAFCWKPLLIEWHKREIVRLEVEAGIRYSCIHRDDDLEGVPRINGDVKTRSSLFYRLSRLIFGWPDERYLQLPPEWRIGEHVLQLHRLGYFLQVSFRVRHWAFAKGLEKLPDFPLRPPEFSIGASCASSSDWLLSRFQIDGAFRRPTDEQEFGTCGVLTVWDLPSRIPLWKAFVDKHNAEERAKNAKPSH